MKRYWLLVRTGAVTPPPSVLNTVWKKPAFTLRWGAGPWKVLGTSSTLQFAQHRLVLGNLADALFCIVTAMRRWRSLSYNVFRYSVSSMHGELFIFILQFR